MGKEIGQRIEIELLEVNEHNGIEKNRSKNDIGRLTEWQIEQGYFYRSKQDMTFLNGAQKKLSFNYTSLGNKIKWKK